MRALRGGRSLAEIARKLDCAEASIAGSRSLHLGGDGLRLLIVSTSHLIRDMVTARRSRKWHWQHAQTGVQDHPFFVGLYGLVRQ